MVTLARSSVTRVRRSTEKDSLIAIRLKFCVSGVRRIGILKRKRNKEDKEVGVPS